LRVGLVGFTKVAQQSHAAAVGGLGQGQQGVELAAHDLFEVFAGRALVDHAALVDARRCQAVGHPGMRWLAVAAGSSGLLVVALDVFGHVQGVPTKRTSGLSMPMPKAMVATITKPSSRKKRF
jgi:hypothetical protein